MSQGTQRQGQVQSIKPLRDEGDAIEPDVGSQWFREDLGKASQRGESWGRAARRSQQGEAQM